MVYIASHRNQSDRDALALLKVTPVPNSASAAISFFSIGLSLARAKRLLV